MDFLDRQVDLLNALTLLYSLFWVSLYLARWGEAPSCSWRWPDFIFLLGFTFIQVLFLFDLWYPGRIALEAWVSAVWCGAGLGYLLGRREEAQEAAFTRVARIGLLGLGLGAAALPPVVGPLVFFAGYARRNLTLFGTRRGTECLSGIGKLGPLLCLNAVGHLSLGFHTFWLTLFDLIVTGGLLGRTWEELVRVRVPSLKARLAEQMLSGRHTIPLFFLLSLLTWALTEGIGTVSLNLIHQRYLETARMITSILDRNEVLLLTGTPSDAGRGPYLRLSRQLLAVRESLGSVRSVYLVRRLLSRIIVMVDSEPAWASHHRPPGTEIELELAHHEEAFRFRGAGVIGHPSPQRREVVTVLIPYRPFAHLNLILGMDIGSQDWMLQLRTTRVFPLILGLIFLYLTGGLFWFGRLIWLERQRYLESESKLKIAIESAEISVWTWPPTEDAPPSHPRSLGEWLAQMPLPQRKEALRSLRQHRDGLRREFEVVYPVSREDGKVSWYLDRGRILERDGAGRPTRMAGVRVDITQRRMITEREKEAERKLMAAQKWESLGILAGGVAHDFNNILTAVLGNIEIASMDLSTDPEQARRHLLIASTAVEKAKDLTQKMLAFAGKSPTHPRRINLVELIRDQLFLWRSSLSPNIHLVHQLEAVPPLYLDPVQVEQILLNLVLNAGEALGSEQGTITVRTYTLRWDRSHPPHADVILADEAENGEYVAVEVQDTGPGISREVLDRLFEPFFSTRFLGRGLGLAAVLGLVRLMRGFILVRTREGHGATFIIGFPQGAPQTDEPPLPQRD